MMMKRALVLASLILPFAAYAQGPAEGVSTSSDTGMVTVASKGLDVRNVLFDLFEQSEKSFVLAPNIRHVLFLSLNEVSFEEALGIILQVADLEHERQNGIYFISKKKAVMPKKEEPKRPEPKPAPLGKLSDADLQKILTTRLPKTDMREVFAEFTKQTGITIEVDKKVPHYKVDAFLIKTSLRYSLDVITQAAALEWILTDQKTVLVRKKAKPE